MKKWWEPYPPPGHFKRFGTGINQHSSPLAERTWGELTDDWKYIPVAEDFEYNKRLNAAMKNKEFRLYLVSEQKRRFYVRAADKNKRFCNVCGIEKSLDEFYTDRSKFIAICKECKKAHARRQYADKNSTQ